MEEIINDVFPVSVEFTLENDKIEPNHPVVKNVRSRVMDGEIVILKKVFPDKIMSDFRNEVLRWGKENEIFAHGESPAKYPDLNYHRIDDGSFPSVCPHLFHQYGFNNIGNLTNEAFSFLANSIAQRLLLIQNSIAETTYDISLQGLRLKVLQYPEGGGFLAEHTHPKEPQQIGIILSLSRTGIDLVSGAACFKTPKGFADSLKDHDIGDVVIFRYDLPHSVSPVNPNKKPIDWTLSSGKWSVVLELRETHGLSHKK